MRMIENNLKGKAEILKVMGHPERLEILKLLLLNREMCIKEICENLGFTQPKVSQHIGIMKEVEIVKSRKEGTRNIYYIDSEFAEIIVRIVFGR
jgi:ArsR family transcriptional regulator